MFWLGAWLFFRVVASEQCYDASVTSFDTHPVVSFLDGTSAYWNVFNPSWIQPSNGTHGKSGLLIRTQNCSAFAGGPCTGCAGTGAKASSLTFAELLNSDEVGSTPHFRRVVEDSTVFGPHDLTDDKGTEDPRVAFDPRTGVYYMLYTCFNTGNVKGMPSVSMCLATSTDPTDPSKWIRHGGLGFGPGSKSGAMMIRDEGPHFLYWGAGKISVTSSNNLTQWSPGKDFINGTLWGNPNVEAGPPPMRLSTGDYVFFHNSWNADFPKPPGYQPAWVVINGSNPEQIIARAPEPLWSPQREAWMEGKSPYSCNVANVAFLEAAHPVQQQDTFRVYFGGADTVIGSATIQIRVTGDQCT